MRQIEPAAQLGGRCLGLACTGFQAAAHRGPVFKEAAHFTAKGPPKRVRVI